MVNTVKSHGKLDNFSVDAIWVILNTWSNTLDYSLVDVDGLSLSESSESTGDSSKSTANIGKT